MSSGTKEYRIAVIPGDGIGKEVVPEGLRVLEAAAKQYRVKVHFDHFDFASYDYYAKHGQMMPDDWKGVWECHIDADWLLTYVVTEDEVFLLRTGTHKDLFG